MSRLTFPLLGVSDVSCVYSGFPLYYSGNVGLLISITADPLSRNGVFLPFHISASPYVTTHHVDCLESAFQ